MAISLGSGVMDVTSFALDGLSRRAEVRANNIANASTPGFIAKTLDFESTIRGYVARGDSIGLRDDPAMVAKDRPGLVNANGNSVDLETETTDLIQDNLMFRAIVNGFNYKVGVIRSAIGAR